MTDKVDPVRLQRLLLDAEDLQLGDFRRERPPSAPPVFRPTARQEGAPRRPMNTEPLNRVSELEALAARIRTCRKCRLADSRTNAVPGIGVTDPLVMVIGEGPGADEDQRGEPFVGAAGKYLDKWLGSVGLSRTVNVFIGNTVKCRPPGNRDPQPDETSACLPYLKEQVRLVRPRLILALGRVACRVLLETNKGITALRGTWFEYEGLPLLPTYHPSAVLRDPNLRRPVWEDLKALKSRLDETDA